VVDLYDLAGSSNNCLGVLQCSAAFNSNSNLEELEQEVRPLVEEYENCDELPRTT
jgi:hypothetical protein